CTGECNLPHVGLTGECKLSLSWSFRLDFFGVLYLFIPWTYKRDNDHLNTYISPSVVCVINRQNIILKYGMRCHFRYRWPVPSVRWDYIPHIRLENALQRELDRQHLINLRSTH